MVYVDVEYCNSCGHYERFVELKKVVLAKVPETKVDGTAGRNGSFEVEVNNKLVHSKLRTLTFPNYQEVARIVEDAAVAEKKPVTSTETKQAKNCCIM